MKQIFTLLFIAVFFINFKAVAQTNLCNAQFNYAVINGNTVQFTPSTNADSQYVSHSWSFGDGTAAQNVFAPLHTYLSAGTYTVTQYVTAVNANGAILCSDSLQEVISVPGTLPCRIIPGFTWKLDSVNHNEVDFTNTTLYPPTGLTPGITPIIWFFGDDSSSTETNPEHTYAKPGTYYVCLRVEGDSSCIKYFCDSVTVPAVNVCNLQSYFYDQPDSLVPNEIHFTNETLNLLPTDSLYWTFGDGSDSRQNNPTHIYTQPGTYNACLTVTKVTTPGTAPCSSKFCRTITIQPVCNLTASYSYAIDSSVTTANTYTFINTSTGSYDSSYWNFGDGTYSYDKNPTHSFVQSGTYNVCLYIKTAIAPPITTVCESHICETVIVPTTCDFQPTYTWKIDSSNNEVYFTSAGIPSGALVSWYFGDGSPLDSVTNASHIYVQPGTYYVCLRVQTSSCLKYQCDSITIPALNVCNLQSYFYDQPDSLVPNEIRFTNETLNLLPTDSLYWTFGDNSDSRQNNPTHIYTQPGTYNACLTVTRVTTPGTAPCTSKFCRTITIQPVCNLTASYSYTIDSSATTADTYTFINTSTGSYDSSYWNFGDGTYSYDKNPTHSFAQLSTYNVCLYIKTAVAPPITTVCESHTCETIVVPTVCDFQPTYTWKIDSSNNEVYFTSGAIPAGALVSWYFGDGSPLDSVTNATHIYAQPGTYYVCLRVQTSSCLKYQCDSITIPAPVLNCGQLSLFSYQKSSITAPYTFAPIYGNSSVQYTWTFGDNTGSHDLVATHVYSLPGNYTACLTAYSNDNCASTTCETIDVQPFTNCDSLIVTFQDYRDSVLPNKFYFFENGNTPVIQQTWTITDASDSDVLIAQDNPTYIFPDTGYYRVCLTAQTIDSCIKEYCNYVHIDSIPTQCQLPVYPNPAQSTISVNMELGSSETIHSYIYNIENELVEEQDQQGFTGNNLIVLDVANLASGFYTIKFIYGNNICVAKFEKI